MNKIQWLSICLLALFWAGCAREESATRRLIIAVGGQQLDVEVADTPELQRKGLMGRRDLADNAGMIFLLDPPRRATFWMRDTFVPLSVAYADVSGRIMEIQDMTPLDETPIISRSEQVAFALEVNQGWFEKHGVRPGSKIEIAPLRADP